jgi:nitric oxide dioxygenase
VGRILTGKNGRPRRSFVPWQAPRIWRLKQPECWYGFGIDRGGWNEEDQLTPEQVAYVQESFAKVVPNADTAAGLFYDRLFVLNPLLRSLFKDDLTAQKKMLMQALGFVVAGLDRPSDIVPAVQALGRRHAGYGVAESDYDTVGAALLWTLEQGLGEAFTAEVQGAWVAAYALLSTTMKDAARNA